MDSFKFGEVVLISFPSTNIKDQKKRPALVLIDTNDEDVIVSRITSGKNKSNYDIPILDWKYARLLMPSTCRINKVTTLEKILIDKKLGKISNNDLKII